MASLSVPQVPQNSPFKQLSSCPLNMLSSNLLALNPREFIIGRASEVGRQAYKYSVDNDVWIKLPIVFKSMGWTMAYHPQSNSVLVWDRWTGDFFSVNLSNRRWGRLPYLKGTSFGGIYSLVVVQGNVHCIGALHEIMDIATSKMKEDHFPLLPEGVNCFTFAVYFKSVDSIIMVAIEKMDTVPTAALYRFSLDNNQYDRVFGTKCSELEREWSWFNLLEGDNEFSFVSSLDERYIVQFEHDFHRDENEKYVLHCLLFDLKVNAVKESKISTPFENGGRYEAVVLGSNERDEKTVLGFVREFKEKEMKDTQEMPQDMMQLMVQWYRNEEVHFVGKQKGGHWKINMDQIIQSTCGMQHE